MAVIVLHRSWVIVQPAGTDFEDAGDVGAGVKVWRLSVGPVMRWQSVAEDRRDLLDAKSAMNR